MEEIIKGWVERDMGGQLLLTIPHRGAADEYMLLESELFPNIHAGAKPVEVTISILTNSDNG